MFRIIPLILLMLACSGRKKEAASRYSFSGTVTQTSSYCGGARPSEEILEEHNKPKPYVGKVLHVREGTDNNAQGKVVLKLITNDSGYFSGSLPAGRYCIVQEEQLTPLDLNELGGNQERALRIDTACVQKWWQGNLADLDLRNNAVKDIHINFHHPCFVSGDVPCIRYAGPLPP